MRRLTRPTILLALAALPIFLLAACGRPAAKIRYVSGGPDEAVSYDSATFQLARGRKVQIVLFRRLAVPIGEADPDFEYVFLELPERPRYGWLKADRVPAYRWVRQGGRDRIWLAVAGQVRMTLADYKQRMRLSFRMTMEPACRQARPVADTAVRSPDPTVGRQAGPYRGGAYVLAANLRCSEDSLRTQSLINRYGGWLQTLLDSPPPAAD